jgi:phosphotransferase system  glucose/maltose/N-acetylglucosamine-specific IIC component
MMNSKLKNCGTLLVRAASGRLQQKLSGVKADFGKYAKASLPALCLIGLNAALSQNIFAQGPIFTGDAGNLSNIIREGLKLMAIVLFCLGAVGIAWGIYNKMTGKEWGSQVFGALLAFAFGTVVAVFWQIAQGRAVNVDTNF